MAAAGHAYGMARASPGINDTIDNIVLEIIWSTLSNNYIIVMCQERILLCPTKTIIAYLQYNILTLICHAVQYVMRILIRETIIAC